MENQLICIVGMTGAGKSTVADRLAESGFAYLRFGQITLDIIKEKGLEINEDNERKIREDLRKEHGMGAFAILNIPKIYKMLKNSNVVVDGLYSWSEYKILKKEYGNRMFVVAIYASPELRYERLKQRLLKKEDKEGKFRPVTREKAQSRDYAEIENIEKGGPIAMADFLITNLGTIEELNDKVDQFIKELDEN